MHVSDQGGLLRARGGGEQRVTPLELFFDLVYVFAVTQLSHRLLDHLSFRGAGDAVCCWGGLVCVGGHDLDHQLVRPGSAALRLMLVFSVMLASLLMSAAIPEAFGELGLMFALAYVAIQVGRTAFVLILWAELIR